MGYDVVAWDFTPGGWATSHRVVANCADEARAERLNQKLRRAARRTGRLSGPLYFTRASGVNLTHMERERSRERRKAQLFALLGRDKWCNQQYQAGRLHAFWYIHALAEAPNAVELIDLLYTNPHGTEWFALGVRSGIDTLYQQPRAV